MPVLISVESLQINFVYFSKKFFCIPSHPLWRGHLLFSIGTLLLLHLQIHNSRKIHFFPTNMFNQEGSKLLIEA